MFEKDFKMDFEEFQVYVKNTLTDRLSEDNQDVEVSLHTVTRNNGTVLHAVTVKPKDSNIAPNIYLEGYFKKYEAGADLDVVMSDIGRVVIDNMNAPEELITIAQGFQNFDFVKDKIIMVAVNAERNRELLAGAPHQRREDLALIYKVMLGDNKDGMVTITIKNEHMAMWNVTTDVIHNLAMKNTKELLPVTIQSIDEVIKEMLPAEERADEMIELMLNDMPDNQKMYVISNKSKINGAASIFYEDEVAKLADKVGTDLYILPSSIHECIAISTDMSTPESLQKMVRTVNASDVEDQEQLSQHVYHFSAKSRTWTLADVADREINTRGNYPRHR